MAVLLAALAGPAARGQTTNGGSAYSIFNFGDIQTGSSTSVAGRSGVEAAMPTAEILNTINPAAWSDLQYTTIQAGLTFNQYQVSDNVTSVAQNDTRLREFAFGFKWSDARGGAAGISLRPYSIVNYRTTLLQSVPGVDSSVTGRVDYSGHGGLSTAAVGGAFKPWDRGGVGATVNLYFGSITSNSDVSFLEGSSSLNPARYESTSRFSGIGGTVGAWVEPIDKLRFAAVLDFGATLTRSRIELSRFVENGLSYVHRDTLADDQIAIAPRFTAGASYATGRFRLGADLWLQNWSQDDFPTIRNSWRTMVGMDRLPSPSLNAEGFERWTFRFGLFREQTYYALAAGSIDATGGSAGFRWPITEVSPLSSGTVLDLALEGGVRGSTDNGLTREVFGRLYIGISLNELWFQRRR